MNTCTSASDFSAPRCSRFKRATFPSSTDAEIEDIRSLIQRHDFLDMAFATEQPQRPEFTWSMNKRRPSSSVRMRLDYILASSSLLAGALQPTRFKTHTDTPGSDHFPVSCVFTHRNKATHLTLANMFDHMVMDDLDCLPSLSPHSECSSQP